uniref:Uncharacterized protein n=1 Tax=Arundo donax TaxID=35708 RepID=A0A0A9HGG7_ARUDO
MKITNLVSKSAIQTDATREAVTEKKAYPDLTYCLPAIRANAYAVIMKSSLISLFCFTGFSEQLEEYQDHFCIPLLSTALLSVETRECVTHMLLLISQYLSLDGCAHKVAPGSLAST